MQDSAGLRLLAYLSSFLLCLISVCIARRLRYPTCIVRIASIDLCKEEGSLSPLRQCFFSWVVCMRYSEATLPKE
ncbi:hypothetical protein J3E72DRAFT_332833 [Bipolaris maydis]|uniref:uncharacterized protein n=1 Tax=Cochliobolus heterostrophus TaxID=5016 RepID=UPI0024D45578|nr:hypothetical protein J3E73DRAFT_312412 [Bipolaris maydis]KAJ5056533.1 hypothetical protein J3E74DRAFT_373324 [Bipolaris maydis]KAJ6196125.1 hypothetical protein J3E72DRAFT_332833 [Bipolaris maydis]KAJ6208219.1 hypothetical protein PSV09DRAFT_2318070 [Bipolaris maydis]KAJ6270209.1 hypothetical protein PSV08DRAFT_303310 [Bipolaris maydis]